MSQVKIILITFVALLWLLPGTVAQEAITPTPAPSKTPTSEAQIEQSEPAQEASTLQEPRTQADLSILTGNVQRPNGIIWHNNKLYTSCNGDSTIYEIDDRTAVTRTYIFGTRNAHTLYAEQDGRGELNLWVPDFQANRVLRIDRLGIETINTELAGPWGIAALNETEFLVSNLQTNDVVLLNRNGEKRPLLTGLRSPTGLEVDGENIYVANNGSARRAIEWVTTQNAVSADGGNVELQSLVSGLQNVTGLVLANDGLLYFAYSLGTRGVVGRVDPTMCRENGGCSNDQVEIVVYTELAAPLAGLTISPDMRLFVHTMFSPDIYWVQLDRPENT